MLGLFEYCARVLDDAARDVNQLTVLRQLLLVTPARRHSLDLLHPSARAPCAVSKSTRGYEFAQTPDQARDDAYHVPQQGAIARMVDVGLDDRRICP